MTAGQGGPQPAPGGIRFAQLAGGTAAFEFDYRARQWTWSAELAHLFGDRSDPPRLSVIEWEGLLFPDDLFKLQAAVETAAETGSFYAEFRARLPEGVRWFAGRGGVLRYEAEGARWLCGFYRDITDRKDLDVRLLAANEILEARITELNEQKRVREVLNLTGASLAAELDLEKLVQTITDAGVQLSGAKFGAFFYNEVSEKGEAYMLYALSGAPREAFSKFPMPRNTAIFGPTFAGTGSVRSDNIRRDPRYGKNPPFNGQPKGHLSVVSYLAVPVVSRSGDVLGGLFFGHPDEGVFTQDHEDLLKGIAAQAAIAIDNARLFSARVKAEEELRHLNSNLEQRVADEIRERMKVEAALRQSQKMEAIGQLTGGIAHDFNNLLQVIIGNLDTMARRIEAGVPSADLRLPVKSVARSAERAATLTSQLLAFSRRQPLQPAILDAGKLVAGMSDLLRRSLGEDVALETVLAGGLWKVEVDPNQLESALLNLAVNARDAMQGGGKLTIETANVHLDEEYAENHEDVRAGQYVMIATSDTGTGMTKEVLQKAFDPFFTTKDVGKGTGLGLSQVYGFVKQSGGHVKIYSEVGQGTTIKIYLRRFTDIKRPHSTEATSEPEIPGGTGELILVVEDEEEVRSYSVDMLRELGYRVLEAADAQQALDKLKRVPGIRLLFSDVGLPGGMNGRELADEAKRLRPGIRVLFTTGYARNAIVHQGRLDQGVEMIEKPFTYVKLARKISKVLAEEASE